MSLQPHRSAGGRASMVWVTAIVCLCGANTMAATNYENIVNGTFDTEVITGWILHNGSREWSAFDADGSPSSGSALLTNSDASSSSEMLFQCVPVTENSRYAIGAQLWIPSGQSNTGIAAIGIYTYASGTCSGAALNFGSTDSATDLDRWVALDGVLEAPAGAASAHVRVVVTRPNSGTYAAYLDNASLLGPFLFYDSFEAGNLTAWSSSVP